jgi:hypothetical protein
MRIFYGIDSPESSITGTGGPTLDKVKTSPDSSNDVDLEGVHEITVSEEENVEWSDLMANHGLSVEKHTKYLKDYPRGSDQLSPLWKKLRKCCHEDARMEERFFDLFAKMTTEGAFGQTFFAPALIPNVTVNWETSEEDREEKEPYHVDFLTKHESIEGGEPTIIELDGKQHFGERSDGVCEASPQKYADTLRKSRFLRRSGFKVIRLANSQLENPLVDDGVEGEVEGFYRLWQKTFNSDAFIDRYEDIDPPL